MSSTQPTISEFHLDGDIQRRRNRTENNMEEIPSQSNNQRNPGNDDQVPTPDHKDEQNRNENRKMDQQRVAETTYGWSKFTLAMLCVVLVAGVAISVPSWKRDTLTTTCDHRVAAAKVEEAMKSEEMKNVLKLQVRTLEIEKTRLETEREQLSKEKITLTVKNENLEKELNKRSASLSLVEGEKKQLESEKMKLEAENTQLKNQASQIDSQKNELLTEKREEKVKFTAKENDNKKLNEEKVALELKLTEKFKGQQASV